MSSWYFVKDGQRNGPMRREALDECIAEGAVDGATLVWRPGMAEWVQASAVPELGLPPPLSPPPLPPRPAAVPAYEARAQEASQTQWRSWAESSGPAASMSPAAPALRAAQFAGFWIRLGAKLIDWAVLYAVAALVERSLVALVFDGVAPALGDWAGMFRLLSYAAPINIFFALAYTVFFMKKHEATPGKRILGLRVVDPAGGRLTTGRIVGRFFAELLSRITFFAGYVMAGFDDQKRTLHDYMCDTRVVRGPREDGQ